MKYFLITSFLLFRFFLADAQNTLIPKLAGKQINSPSESSVIKFADFTSAVKKQGSIGFSSTTDETILLVAGIADFQLLKKNGLNFGLTSCYFMDIAVNELNNTGTKGFFATDIFLNYTKPRFEIGIRLQNLLNTKQQEAEFENISFIKDWLQDIPDLNYTPGVPFFAKLKMAVFF